MITEFTVVLQQYCIIIIMIINNTLIILLCTTIYYFPSLLLLVIIVWLPKKHQCKCDVDWETITTKKRFKFTLKSRDFANNFSVNANNFLFFFNLITEKNSNPFSVTRLNRIKLICIDRKIIFQLCSENQINTFNS